MGLSKHFNLDMVVTAFYELPFYFYTVMYLNLHILRGKRSSVGESRTLDSKRVGSNPGAAAIYRYFSLNDFNTLNDSLNFL